MSSHLPAPLAEFLESLELFPEREDRIQCLMEVADQFKPVDPAIASRPFDERHRVPHCESEAFVFVSERPDGAFDFHFAVENPQGVSAMALAAVLTEGLSGQPPEQALRVEPDIVYQIFGRELSMGKGMGLTGMVQTAQAMLRAKLAQRSAPTEVNGS